MKIFRKIYDGQYLHRLDNIHQWQDRFTFQKESVAQHSYKVSVFAQLLLYYLFEDSNANDYEALRFRLDCIETALLHDFDEAILLRDLSHETKYNSFNGVKLRDVVNSYVDHQLQEEITGYHVKDSQKEYRFFACVTGSMDEEVCKFVKVCDWFALLFFIKEEVRLGNHAFQEREKYCTEKLIDSICFLKQDLQQSATLSNLVNYSFLDELIGFVRTL